MGSLGFKVGKRCAGSIPGFEKDYVLNDTFTRKQSSILETYQKTIKLLRI